MRSWAIPSGPGFLTYPHYDAGGLCTWVQMTSGAKIWVYLRLANGRSSNNGNTVAEMNTAAFKQGVKLAKVQHHFALASSRVPPLATPHCLVLQPGSIL